MNLQGLIVCRNILDKKIFSEGADKSEIAAKLVEKAELLGLSGNLYRSYLIYLLANEPNLISTNIELRGGKIGDNLRELFKNDVEIMLPILRGEILSDLALINNYKPTVENKSESFRDLTKKLSKRADSKSISKIFIKHWQKFGYGDIATYRAFRWDNDLIGVRHFETIKFADLIGYEHQKELLIGNTTAFVDKKPANNVLLVGARGTGKSSSVKALVNEFYSQGLRLVQITKPQLKFLPEIMENLRKFMSKRFIIFLDDLSFDESETEYKYLKSAIEGGVESRPENVLIYATSNRRHLIRETWRDRDENHEEVYRDDSTNETISLSDRFGLIIHYYAPTQAEYLEIIRSMLNKNGVEMDDETLRLEGLRWEMSHSGRNGRTAQQFVNNYLGQR